MNPAKGKSIFKRRWTWLAIVYLLLLLWSHLVRLNSVSNIPPSKKAVQAFAVENSGRLNHKIKIAYREFTPAENDSLPVLILLHGSPMGSESFDDLGPWLGQFFRVIVPDLPGFNASTAGIPDYSVRAHADYIMQLMDSLQIKSAHLISYSMGGGVALNLAHFAPQRVASIDLLSGIGVQELELLGDYHLNHAVHGAQLVFFWLLQEAFPHFGAIDHSMLNLRYARNFYDTDQRPLREYLNAYRGPMLIQHGIYDKLVPLNVAREHFRIVPQSELIEYNAGHGMTFIRWQMIAGDIRKFVERVEAGEALTFEKANASRIAQAQLPFDSSQTPPAHGLAFLLIIFLLAVATFLSEDLTCIGAGLMIAKGTIGFAAGTLACFFGIFIGDLGLYWAGKYLGRPAISRMPLKWFVRENELRRSTDWFAAKGPAIIIASRFLPGSRLPTYLAAGMLHMNFWRFAFFFFIAAIIWTPILVGLAAVLGNEIYGLFDAYQKYALISLLVTILIFFAMMKVIIPLFSFKGRRLLLSAWRRKVRWEFWPPYIFYIPIVFYVIYLGIKFRSLTLFTLANPAIPEGGFLGESKADILNGLSKAKDFVAKYTLIKKQCPLDGGEEKSPTRGGEGGGKSTANHSKSRPNTSTSHNIKKAKTDPRFTSADKFMEENNLSYPIVLKPDQGQRGSGVAIIRSDAELQAYFEKTETDTIIQEYVPGYEFGVFYVRKPNEKKGFIFSITDKRFPTITSDGKRTLEELILTDDRAVCMAPFYLRLHQNSLYDVPVAGEKIKLVELGTHCRGAMFLDGSDLRSPELEAVIDQISQTFSGFYFGRYDIRTPSIEDFRQGKNFKIVELNGVTSEATSIYDPKNSLLVAYRKLMRQWRLAFEIGAQNRQRVMQPVSLGKLLRLLMK